MKKILVSAYVRNDTYKGYSRINHYHIPVKMECYFNDYSDERGLNVTLNGALCTDTYEIVTLNYNGDVVWRYLSNMKEDANHHFKCITSWEHGWRKVFSTPKGREEN